MSHLVFCSSLMLQFCLCITRWRDVMDNTPGQPLWRGSGVLLSRSAVSGFKAEEAGCRESSGRWPKRLRLVFYFKSNVFVMALWNGAERHAVTSLRRGVSRIFIFLYIYFIFIWKRGWRSPDWKVDSSFKRNAATWP